jgi:hypothetical protein
MKPGKPLTSTETKALMETFRRHSRDLEVYDARTLSERQRKALLQSDHAWIVAEKSKRT